MSKLKGFSLIELMIVIAIIGILASIAVPSYKTFIIKARISETIAFMDSYKTKVAEYYTVNGSLPDTATGRNLFMAGTQGSNWALYYDYGLADTTYLVIQAQLKTDQGLGDASGTALEIRGITRNDGSILWNCGPEPSHPTPLKYLPATCQTPR